MADNDENSHGAVNLCNTEVCYNTLQGRTLTGPLPTERIAIIITMSRCGKRQV